MSTLRGNSSVFSRLLNVGSDGREVTSAGRVFNTGEHKSFFSPTGYPSRCRAISANVVPVKSVLAVKACLCVTR